MEGWWSCGAAVGALESSIVSEVVASVIEAKMIDSQSWWCSDGFHGASAVSTKVGMESDSSSSSVGFLMVMTGKASMIDKGIFIPSCTHRDYVPKLPSLSFLCFKATSSTTMPNSLT